MTHQMMTACGISLLHRYKYKKVLGKLKGGSAQRKGAGMKMPPMRLAVMPTPTKRQIEKMVTTMPVPRRTLQMRS